MDGIRGVEIIFPEPVDLSQSEILAIESMIEAVCLRYSRKNPGRLMWLLGRGCRIIADPETLADDEPMDFADDVVSFECGEREVLPHRRLPFRAAFRRMLGFDRQGHP